MERGDKIEKLKSIRRTKINSTDFFFFRTAQLNKAKEKVECLVKLRNEKVEQEEEQDRKKWKSFLDMAMDDVSYEF